MFNDLKIKRCYRTKEDDLINDLISPLLKESIKYDRGTGYFSLNVLSDLSEGLIPYIKRGGDIRIITSVELRKEELEIINNGYEVAKNTLTNELLKKIDQEISEVQALNLDLITNLLAANRFKIRVAYLTDGGIYHEKTAYFEDNSKNRVWFSGSSNETYSGYKKNVESVIALKSWCGDNEDIDEQCEYFEELWNDHNKNIKVFDLPSAAKEKLFSKYKHSSGLDEAIEKIEGSLASHSITSNKRLYKYQEDAIREFIENGGVHFYEMATGTGKTFTAVKTLEHMVNTKFCEDVFAIILVPQIDLQVQWARALDECNITYHLFGGIAQNKDSNSELTKCRLEYFIDKKMVVLLSVYDTYFQKLNEKVHHFQKMNKMIIVDEAHGLSAKQMRALKDNSYMYRLGLSATPERHNEDETKTILDYFTPEGIEPFKYSIEEAIDNNFLSHYEYHPISVHVSEEDFKKYQAYTKQLIYLQNEKHPDREKIKEISNQRSIIIKKSNSKTLKLGEMVANHDKYDFKNSVVYCGLGKDNIDGEESIIDQVTKSIVGIGDYRVSQFTSHTIDRPNVIKEFETGYYDTLVAIKCFDEGVDVPKLDKIYIMASDSLKRQTIQRRGRVLRKCTESGKTIAHIFDMIALPPEGVYDGIGVSSLVKNESKRIIEYARLADNHSALSDYIDNLFSDYDIEVEDFEDEE